MNAEFNRMRTDLANNFASAGAALLDYMTIDGTKTAALAAIPETDPQQYAIAGTLAGIAQMLPKAAPGVEAMTDERSSNALHNAIMNLPCERTMSHFATRDTMIAYKEGHRDARHAAAELSLAATTQASTAQADLVRIGKLIATQDNRYTDQPMFIVQQRRRLTGFDTDYCDQIIWLCSEDDYSEASAEEAAELEAEYQETGRSKNGWMRTGYTDQWEFVTACFTEQGCKDYLKRDGHNLKEPRIYADGSYRNEEFRTIRNWLMGLAATSSTDAQAAAEVRDAALVEALAACERVQEECAERNSNKWPELQASASEGAGDCVDAIHALRAGDTGEQADGGAA